MPGVKHGGDIYSIAREYGFKPEDILDFSGNINPLGMPESVKRAIIENLDILSKYPDPEYLDLRQAIYKYSGVRPENIIVGNGGTELISLFFKILNPRSGLILMPTYSEYEREIMINGGRYEYYRLKEERDFVPEVDDIINCIAGHDLLVVCNPNNPTGQAIYTDDMIKILAKAKKCGCFVFVDETYVEFVEDIDSVSAARLVNEFDNLFIIRGISKFFGTPGLRIGYGLTSNKEIMEKMLFIKDPWTVSSIAQVAGQAVFGDIEYQERSKKLIREEREYISKEMSRFTNIKAYNTTANFFLCKILDNHSASALREHLLRYAMDVRDASNFPYLSDAFFRFCILDREDNEKLIKLLNVFFN
ncbi:threonine-phosphate decarboxylase CobD [Calorimonas adulescens]|uniref:threonine-phosphate decarboxylase CobD n=1 Tax=Calorimonas adulescens TaxID=2606906 RepID=UPI001396BBCB|nr:threonine-phosphate decarboxylase CobD [Calorimonas adulescens]